LEGIHVDYCAIARCSCFLVLPTSVAPCAPIDWSAIIDRKIAAALGTMYGRMMTALEVVAEATAEQRENAANDLHDETRH
jgi:hypothetical protein